MIIYSYISYVFNGITVSQKVDMYYISCLILPAHIAFIYNSITLLNNHASIFSNQSMFKYNIYDQILTEIRICQPTLNEKMPSLRISYK